jgi:hypothetical protein
MMMMNETKWTPPIEAKLTRKGTVWTVWARVKKSYPLKRVSRLISISTNHRDGRKMLPMRGDFVKYAILAAVAIPYTPKTIPPNRAKGMGVSRITVSKR